ncbi:hypothetical protein EDD11_010153 [Mortierella claussenii]|nr:hypothetical protein EDD11_010153 [Mortierella claussenii]
MHTSLLLSLGAVLITASLVTNADAQQQQCNGYAELCTKTYDKVAYATTHNAYAFTPPGALATNQDNDIPTQLKDGIRAFMLDAYPTPSGNAKDIELCHGSCQMLDGGPLSKTLGQIKAFMDANPNEVGSRLLSNVITILWENAGNLKPAQYQATYAAAGIDKYSYAQATGSTAWPTLAQLISSGKRLLNFVDQGADASVPWLMAEYSFIFETPWEIIKGDAYPCTVDRPKNQRQQMYVLNHFIYGKVSDTIEIPQPGAANQTNGPDLINHVQSCQSTFKQIPSFVAVDFYEKGSLLQTVAQVNGVKWNNQLPTPAKTPGGGAAGTGNGTSTGQGSGGSSRLGSGSNSLYGTGAWNKMTLGVVAVIAGSLGMMTL